MLKKKPFCGFFFQYEILHKLKISAKNNKDEFAKQLIVD